MTKRRQAMQPGLLPSLLMRRRSCGRNWRRWKNMGRKAKRTRRASGTRRKRRSTGKAATEARGKRGASGKRVVQVEVAKVRTAAANIGKDLIRSTEKQSTARRS